MDTRKSQLPEKQAEPSPAPDGGHKLKLLLRRNSAMKVFGYAGYCAFRATVALLALRIVTAAWLERNDTSFELAILLIGFAVTSAKWPTLSPWLLVACVPFVNGLQRSGLLQVRDGLSCAIAATVLGRELWHVIGRLRRGTIAKTQPTVDRTIGILGLTIGFGLIASLLLAIFRAPTGAEWLATSTFPPSHPLYFLTTAFLWLAGIYLFLAVLIDAPALAVTPSLPVQSLVIHGAGLALFFLLQYVFQLPAAHEFSPPGACDSPYEDKHALGSVAVLLLATTCLPSWSHSWRAVIGRVIIGLFLIGVIVDCWSRAAWLAGGFVLGFVTYLHLPRGWLVAFGAALLVSVIGLNLNTLRDQWWKNPYVWRVTTLVKLEPLENKSPGRVFMFSKATRMIESSPLTGTGLGSFYREAPRFASPDDPEAAIPNFAHNALLQFAAEAGIPLALALLSLPLFALGLLLRQSLREGGLARPSLTMGVAIGLMAYGLTQLTSNSINIYATQQPLVWVLLAIVAVGITSPSQPEQ